MDKCQEPEQITTDSAVVSKSALKRSKKRVITAARKEQNKLAQRAYRRRQKEQKRVETRSTTSGSRRLEPRRDNSDTSHASNSSNSSYNALIADPGFSPPKKSGSNIINIDLAAICQQLGLDNLPCSSIWQSEIAAVSSAPASTAQIDENKHPPALIAMATRLRGSLEDNPTAVFRACLTNAICIGMDLTALMYCERPCMSPFYQPAIARMSGDPAALIAASSHGSLPPALRPTLAQILIPHHASFDLIPLPRLRDRAILMCAALPHMFSLWEMKLDIYTRNALLCQGHDSSTGTVAQPWDTRCWQATPWFLSKWKMVVNTDDVEASLSLPGIPGMWM
ncbi:hypothetical protein GGR51DRAFT_338687 [Nemania sp. FL0031]|nr:hypothetical protein GGR51DRAFT_338687 [Nemania sp. FL0031]